jgi:hypothetical protein
MELHRCYVQENNTTLSLSMRMYVQCLCTDLIFIQGKASSFNSCRVHNIQVSVLSIIYKGKKMHK